MYWLSESGEILSTEDGENLVLHTGPETRPVVIGDAYTVTPLAGQCEPWEIEQVVADHSWLGAGLVSLDGEPAINATIRLRSQVEAQPVAPLALGTNPEQWAWRVQGWMVEIQTSDITPQVMDAALSGAGPVCLAVRLQNEGSGQFRGLSVSVMVVIPPVDSLDLIADNRFTEITLTGHTIGSPAVIQDLEVA